MERKDHHAHSKHTVSQSVKKTGEKVEATFSESHHHSHGSSSHSHHEVRIHHESSGHHIGGSSGHHITTHTSGSSGHHITSHTSGSIGHHTATHTSGSIGHHTAIHTSGAIGHHTATHTSGSIGHHTAAHTSGSIGHHAATLTSGSIGHHVITHINGSSDHPITTHVNGSVSHEEASKAEEPVKITPSIGGFFVSQTKERVGIYQALQRKLVSEEVTIALLEAQAATGNIIDPSKNEKLTVEAAVKQGLVGQEYEPKLLLANSAVTGYKHNEETISVFEAFKKGLVGKSDAVRFLQAQVATGGIINHVTGNRLPIAEAEKLHYIDENFLKTLSGPSEFSSCYLDPNTKEHSSYQELLAKTFTDSQTGLALLTLHESLQGLRRSVNLEELYKAKIITQAQYDDVREGKQTIQSLRDLKEVQQCLSGLASIGAVYVESTKKTLSVYQALKKNVLPSDYAVALLEAQAASGFIIDPENNKTFTVIEAVQEGLVGLELKEKLLKAESSVTGFNDPYTGKKISLFQAIKKELIDRNLGLNLLEVQFATGGIIDPFHSFHVPLEVAFTRGLLDEDTAKALTDPANRIPGFFDPNTNDKVTYEELRKRSTYKSDLNMYYFPLKLTFVGIRGKVTSDELLDSQIIDQATYQSLQEGQLSIQDVAEEAKVKRYLRGTGLIAGVADVSTNEIKSIYQAIKEHLLMPGTGIALLEAQAATGYLIDPTKNLKFSVDDAVKNGLVGPEFYEKLLLAEKAATGYKDPSSSERLSLFQAIKQGFVAKDHGLHLLDVQLATGGIIDPSKKHRVPQEVAITRGYFDQDTNKVFLDKAEDIKGFFDPNLKENLTYAHMLERSVIDIHSGLYLTPVFESNQDTLKTSHSFIDYYTKVTLEGIKLSLTFGKFKGRLVSLWQLLFSEYFTIELRESFIKLYKSGSLSAEEFSSRVEAEIKKQISSTKVTFEGLRETVTAGQLLESEIIDKELFDKLQQGEASVKDVESINTVKKYLQGTGSIGGLILTDTQEKMSIYQAKRKGFLMPGTSLILLEAQAATGYIIDPVKNKNYSVDEALKANIIGPDYYEKLLSAEKSVTGYKDPYTGERISLFQAMNKGLIVKDHGIRLLEAQIASGGIIDPINSHRIPVDVAYKRGYFDKKMNIILSDPSDDTKGFFDPNTKENLTYLQLKEKCITEPSTNLCLLPLLSARRQFSINNHIRDSFRNTEIFVRYGRYKGQTLSAWVLINSEFFSEWRRRELLEQYRLKRVTIEQIIIIIEEEIKKWTEIRVPALRHQVNIYELLEYEIITREVFEHVLEGKITTEEVVKIETVQRYLHGTGVLGGIIIRPSGHKISFYEATKRNILLPSTVLPLLEAQAATGYIVDPANNHKYSVDEALKTAVIDPQVYERLAFAEEAVTGYRDPFSGQRISLFQAMKKGLVEEKHAKQLLEAQLATGGVIDPVHSFHLPASVATKHGYLSEDILENLSHPTDDIKAFYDPSTKEKVTYAELLSRSHKDDSTGFYLLPLPEDFAEVPVQNIYSDEDVRHILKTNRIEDRNITVWDLIHSGYFTEEQQYEILEKFKAKKVTLEELIIEVQQIVRNNDIIKTTHISFEGLRGKVSLVSLLDLGIITRHTFDEIVKGVKSVEEVSQLPEVKRALRGTGSISGVFLPSTKEKLSIYQALKNNLLLPANAIMLLEAQAATGFITDPVTNEKFTADDAVKAGVVGPEFHEKLLIAESAVTGYSDPYTGNKISLGQAIHKNLISQKEGVPLLQAQLASGGIIDPLHCYYVPLQMAYRFGLLDEEIWKQTVNLEIYVDPNTKQKISYQQLKERSYTDPETGALLLSLSESSTFYAEEHLIDVFKTFRVTVNVGRFKGQTVSLWELLNSEYVSADKRKEFLLRYKTSSSETLQEVINIVKTSIQETDAASLQIKFKGFRKQVSATDLFQSEVIDKKTLDELNLGKKTINEVTEMDSVKRYLEGTNCIAGVLIEDTNTKMSIHEAMVKRILMPGTALVLLEAQAATGYIVDPIKNEKLSVDEALAKGLIGNEVHAKLLSAEQAVTGYTDPYNGEKISLFQAMQKNIIVECHGIRLLEAQIATGGIIDPVHSHRVPVEVAYKRGYFNEDMNKILLDPSDDTKGFFDPNTRENLTYLQLVDRCIRDPETGLYLLQVVKKGENYFYITDKMKADFTSRTIHLQTGKYAFQTVSVWDVLYSHYVTDLRRRELVRLYTLGVLSIEQLISTITTIVEEYEAKSSSFKFQVLRGEVSATDLYNAEIIDQKTLVALTEGKTSVETVSKQESVRKYLEGTGYIAGVISLPTNETLSIFEAIKRGILSRDVGLTFLQAQAASGRLFDPTQNKAFTIPDALSEGLIDSDFQDQLEIPEKAFAGFTDPVSGNIISVFQAIKRGVVPVGEGISLLDVQLATGGIVDPRYGLRLPLQVAYRRGYLDEDFYFVISEAEKRGFVDPNTHERITYKNLLDRCVKDSTTGLYFLQLAEKRDDYFYIDDPTKKLLRDTIVKMNEGKFKGQDISLWDLLSSTYISKDKKKELVKLYKSKTSSALKDIVGVIQSIIEERVKDQNIFWFQGLRKQVTATELFDAGILSQETLDGLKQASQTVNEVAGTDSVKRYLEGTSCIAGLLVPSRHDPSKKEKVNIYDAMLRHLLRPGTALILLEAQAATGFVIDSIKNQKLSVDEALSAGVIGYDIYEKLLSAERGVTGYTDPYTGEKISLFQAMQKDLIVKEHGIRLLEAQIATGGIIDPVHSHRVPVEVAYKRGYFDEELNQILLDPTDDTKGFFDPNTHENLTYLQLLQRCVQDPDTGLCMLELKDSKFSQSQIQNILQSKSTQITVGEFQGKSVSIWELINSSYFSAERREELLKKFESGTITVEEILAMTIKVVHESAQTLPTDTKVFQTVTTDSGDQVTKAQTSPQSVKVDVSVSDVKGKTVSVSESEETVVVQPDVSTSHEQSIELDNSIPDDEIQKALESISIHVTKGQYAGQDLSMWDLLNSKYIPEETKQEFLGDYKLTMQGIMEMVVESIKETEQKSKFKTEYILKLDLYNVIQTVQIEVTEGEFKGQKHSVWHLLNSKYFSEERRRALLERFNSGALSIDELIITIITEIHETEERRKKLKFKGLRRQVTASELLTSEIIDQNTLTELAQGSKTVEEVTQMDSVKRYLEGTSCIAGVLVPSPKDPSKKTKMSIYNAMLKNILPPGTALILLEAQAATGFVIDPVNNKKLSVDEAVEAGLVGLQLHKKLLSAEKSVTGYTDPYTGDKISLFQAMQKDLIVKDHGIRLLEAQIATGGIIDPVHSHRIPVEVAYKRGYFDEKMNQILSDPTDDTKGFFDPNTQENLTYLQLLQRCVQDPDTGLCMLEMRDKKTLPETSLKSITIHIKVGQYEGQSVSYWELLHSKYFTEQERLSLLNQYRSKTITSDELKSRIILTIEKWEQQNIRETVDGLNLEDAVETITEESKESILKTQTVEITKEQPQVTKVEEVAKEISVVSIPKTQTYPQPDAYEYHKALSAFTVRVEAEDYQRNRVSLWDALHSRYVSEENRNAQLRIHQSTVDKLKQRILRLIEDAETKHETEIQHKLDMKLIEVSVGEFKGQNVSVWFLLHSKYFNEEKRKELLEKYKLGLLTNEEILKQVVEIIEQAEKIPTIEPKKEVQQELELTFTEVSIGEFSGKNVSVWFLLFSKYISEEKRNELLEKYKSGTLTVEEMIKIIITIIKKREERRELKFKGLRRQVTASELLQSEIIDQSTLNELTEGSKTVEDVTQMDSVKRYLEGTSCIAGVFVTSKTDPSQRKKLTIYDAMLTGILRRGTALILLEAQAATGFVIDPIQNKKLSVEEALAAGLIGHEIFDKLLSAEKGVTGYTDPYTSEKISLFQAMKKELIVKDHGIRLLEAQIATGGIIDPVHSHRVPVEVAYKRGYFDEEMNQILSDPSDDTKGFFDPNTHENLTYLQLLQRCVQDPETGLFMLDVNAIQIPFCSKPEVKAIQVPQVGAAVLVPQPIDHDRSLKDDEIRKALQSIRILVRKGEYAGQEVSVWDLLHSRYISEEKRQELLGNYKLTLQDIIQLVSQSIEGEDQQQSSQLVFKLEHGLQEETLKTLQATEIEVTEGEFQGQKQSVWYLLNSRYFSEEKRRELLQQITSGSLTTDGLIQVIIQIIHETEEYSSNLAFEGLRKPVTASELLMSEIIDQKTLRELAEGKTTIEEVTQMDSIKRYLEGTSCIAGVLVPSSKDPSKKTKMSIYNAMLKNILTQGTALILLEAQAATGFVIDPLSNKKLSVDEAVAAGLIGKELHTKLLSAEKAVTGYTDPYTGDKISLFQAMQRNLIVKDHGIRLLEAQIATGGIIDPVHSHRVPVEVAYKRGYFDEEMNQILSDPTDDTKGFFDPNTLENLTYLQLLNRCVQDPDTGLCMLNMKDKNVLEAEKIFINSVKLVNVQVKVGQYEGRSMSAWDLLYSKYFTEEKRQLFLNQFTSKQITSDQLISSIVSTIEDWEEHRSGGQTVNKENLLQSHSIAITKGRLQGQTFSVWDLLNSQHISTSRKEEILQKYFSGALSLQEIVEIITRIAETEVEKTETDAVTTPEKKDDDLQRALNAIVVNIKTGQFQGQNLSLWDILHSNYLSEDKRNDQLVKHQHIVEKLKQAIAKLIEESEGRSEDDIQQEFEAKLTIVEKAEIKTEEEIKQALELKVTEVSAGEFKGQNVSVWSLLYSKDISEEKRKELLETYKQGTLTDEELIKILITIVEKAKIKTEEEIKQALELKVTEVSVGEFKGQSVSVWSLLYSKDISEEKRKELLETYKQGTLTYEELIKILITIVEKAEIKTEEDIKQALELKVTEVSAGEFKGQSVSVWSLLYSKDISEEKRKELLETYKQGTLTDEELIKILITIVEKAEIKTEEEIKQALELKVTEVSAGEFKGQSVSVWSLLYSKDISEEKRKELLETYKQGTLTYEELIKILITIVEKAEIKTEEEIKQALELKVTEVSVGEFKGQNVSVWTLLYSKDISEEKRKELLETYKQGTLTDEELIKILITIVEKAKIKTEEDIKQALELKVTEVSAGEFKGQNVSVWTLLYSKYISEEKRKELLETYKQGTLTYEELIKILITIVEKAEIKTEEEIKQALELKVTEVSAGEFKGQSVSVWSLLYSKDISEEKRKELLETYKQGTLTYEELIKILITIVEKAEIKTEEDIKQTLELKVTEVSVGEFKGQSVSVWSLLYSKDISEEKRKELLETYKQGTLTYEELIKILITIVEKAEIKTEEDIKQALELKVTEVSAGEFKGQSVSVWSLLYSKDISEEKRKELLETYKQGTLTDEELIKILITIVEKAEIKTEEEIKQALELKVTEVSVGEFKGQNVSVWTLLYSKDISEEKRKELLETYKQGTLTYEELIKILITIVEKAEIKTEEEIKQALELKVTEVSAGEFKGQSVSVWTLLYSKYISEEKRKELLETYKQGTLTDEELIKILITIVEKAEIKTEEEIKQALELKVTEVSVGEFKGQNVSVWTLLYSKYISEEKRKELLEKYKSGTLTVEELLRSIITIIEEAEKSQQLKFKGLRRQVTASELLQSEIIDQSTINELTEGSKTVEDVTQMDSVKRYLEGTSCIAGVFVTSKTDPSQRKKLTIYDAMLTGILRRGTALILLEAQAATGFVIDPIQNKKLSVEEALAAGLIGHEIYDKLLSAEKGVTGYTDPYTSEKISLFQAMKKELIVKDHGIRLLEAQIATGGIIDPVHSHRVPVEVAYKRGYFDEEMNQILSDPSDDTKGFFDPNTHENLTYLQLLQRCVQDPETDLYMLDVTDASREEQRIKNSLQSKTVEITAGEFKGKAVSVWDLLYSQYISAEKKEELLGKYHSGILTIEELMTIIVTIIRDKTEGELSPETQAVKQSFLSVKIEISIGSFQEKSMSLWDLLHSKYIPEDKREELIEKFKSGTLAIEEIINIVLTMIQKSVSGSTVHTVIQEVRTSAPTTAEQWPPEDQLIQALQVIPSDLSEDKSAQSTASIWDFLQGKDVAEEKKNELLQTYKSSVRDVMSVCTDIIEGRTVEGSTTKTIVIDAEKQKVLQDATTEISIGQFKGQRVSVWDLLNSKYLTSEKQKDILVRYLSGTLTVEEIIKIIVAIIQETEERSCSLKFKGLRRQITATELLSSEIIDQKTLDELTQGSKTLEEVTQMSEVKRYLEGAGCIAGVLVPCKKDPIKRTKMNVYQAMWRQVLLPGTALVLLEAQAATGFIIDSINNKKLSVDEAVSAGVIGRELHAKLLSAERAVTGYTDPYTGEKISLFQAMQKNLIVKEHGIRLLEAQIATGGIIDPVHSHRIPVDVAYKRGYFDQEMDKILSDESDDTKGFFDPNTKENLTYLQLLKRCVKDPDTGLYMLEVKDSRSPLSQTDQALKSKLEGQTIELNIGQYQGQKFSVWELLNSYHLADVETERQELLTKYKSGSIKLEELTAKILSLIKELENKRSALEVSSASQSLLGQGTQQTQKRIQTQNFLQSVEVDVTVGEKKGEKSSLWGLLHASYITAEKREELIEGYESGGLVLEDLMKRIMQILMESEKTSVHMSIRQEVRSASVNLESIPETVKKSLQIFTLSISSEEFTGDHVSLWDILHSKSITADKRLDLLTRYYFTVRGITTTLTSMSSSKTVTAVTKKPDTETFLKSVTVQVNIGAFKLEGKSHSLWALLHTNYISEDQRKDLIEQFESGKIDWQQLFKAITTIIKESEEKTQNIKFQEK
ncbi:epiplakin [Hyperolius riggenbachi]|uniref:epiplakin n=1 Tax=Hyperolius riggenbachi TaxID=752182 RepID=UPI0035A34471